MIPSRRQRLVDALWPDLVGLVTKPAADRSLRTATTSTSDSPGTGTVHLMDRQPSGYPPAMHVDIPEGKHAIEYVWGEMVPGIGPAASKFSRAVYAQSTLGLREFEAARLRIAQINGCLFCQDWRTERDGEKVEESFAEAVEQWRTTDAFDDRTRLAAEFAERYAIDHHGIDQDFWDRMSAHYTDAEIVELSMCLGSWLAFGRLNHVLGLDTACVLPSRR